MFLIPTYLAASAIHGFGAFTSVSIPKDTLICRYEPAVDWELTPEQMAALPEPTQSRMRQYAFLHENGNYVLCGDNSMFMNHSDEPNCYDKGVLTWANRDIAAGEELTSDYREFDIESAALGAALFGEEAADAGAHA